MANTINKANATKAANEIASEMGFKDSQSLMENLKVGVATKDINATKTAATFLNTLTLKVLKQEFYNTETGEIYQKFIDSFPKDVLDAGNSKEYIFNLLTGLGDYDKDSFVPSEITTPIIESAIVSMYERNAQNQDVLTANAFQWKKGLTIMPDQWIYYFVNNKLSEFISGVIGDMKKSIYLKLFDKIIGMILNSTPQKVITGSATNMFNAYALEVFPEIDNMLTLTDKYNFSSASKYATSTPRENIVMLMSIKNKRKYMSGVLSQMFQVKFGEFASALPAENIFTPAKKFTIAGQSASIVFTDTEYIDDNTIIVFDKTQIKHLSQINITETQTWAENLSTQNTIHFWGVVAILNQCKIFKYTNANLGTSPAGL